MLGIAIFILSIVVIVSIYMLGHSNGFDKGYWKAAEILTAPPAKPVGNTARDSEIKAQAEQFIAQMENTFKKVEAIQKTLKELGKLNEEELDLLASVDRPSASASHSLYKNKLIGQIKEIRSRRIDLVKLLLSFGYDPLTTFVDENNQKVSMRLSDILMRLERLSDNNGASVTEIKKPEKKKPTFTLITNEEGDDHDND